MFFFAHLKKYLRKKFFTSVMWNSSRRKKLLRINWNMVYFLTRTTTSFLWNEICCCILRFFFDCTGNIITDCITTEYKYRKCDTKSFDPLIRIVVYKYVMFSVLPLPYSGNCHLKCCYYQAKSIQMRDSLTKWFREI